MLELKNQNNGALLAITQPCDNDIIKKTTHLVPYLRELGIIHYWVYENGDVTDGDVYLIDC